MLLTMSFRILSTVVVESGLRPLDNKLFGTCTMLLQKLHRRPQQSAATIVKLTVETVKYQAFGTCKSNLIDKFHLISGYPSAS
jgi:hypothetical protein